MRGAWRELGLPWAYSVAMHAVLLGLLVVSFAYSKPYEAPPAPIAIEATVVDEQRIQAEIERLEALDAERRAEEQAQQRQLAEQAEAARRARERVAALERERQEREVQAEQERERLARAEVEREAMEQAAVERQAQLERQQAEEQARLAELERKRKEEEDRLAALAREREEEERQQREAAEARQRAQLESELRAALEQEEQRRVAERSGLLNQYKTLIRQKVQRNWVRPPSAVAGLTCEVQVTQIPGGEVVDVRIGTCNGDAAVMRSIEAAVYKASPLPPPPDPSLFERNLVFRFEPE